MTRDKLIATFLNGSTGLAGNLRAIAAVNGTPGVFLFSYDEPIARLCEKKLMIVEHDYTATTNKHISEVYRAAHAGGTSRIVWRNSRAQRETYDAPKYSTQRVTREELRALAKMEEAPPAVERGGRRKCQTVDTSTGRVIPMGAGGPPPPVLGRVNRRAAA